VRNGFWWDREEIEQFLVDHVLRCFETKLVQSVRRAFKLVDFFGRKLVSGRFVPVRFASERVERQAHLFRFALPIGPGSCYEPLHDALETWLDELDPLRAKPPRFTLPCTIPLEGLLEEIVLSSGCGL
jgi:hypothetical protein